VVLVGGSAERAARVGEAVARLGGTAVYSHRFAPGATHLVTDAPRRTEKLLCCAAAGAWVLRPGFLDASAAAGRWAREEDWEWHEPGRTRHGLWLGAPRHWRRVWRKTGRGPFSGVRALLAPATDPPPDVLAALLRAGGAETADAARDDSTAGPGSAWGRAAVAAGANMLVQPSGVSDAWVAAARAAFPGGDVVAPWELLDKVSLPSARA